MFEKFTEEAIKAIMLAQEESRRLGHNFVGTEQILIGLIGERKGTAGKVLKSIGLTLKDTRIEVEKIIGRGSGLVENEIPFTPRAKKIIYFSLEEAKELDHNYVGTEHLLLGIAREDQSIALRILENLNINIEELKIGQFLYIGDVRDDKYTFLAGDKSVIVGVKTARGAIEDEETEEEAEDATQESSKEGEDSTNEQSEPVKE